MLPKEKNSTWKQPFSNANISRVALTLRSDHLQIIVWMCAYTMILFMFLWMICTVRVSWKFLVLYLNKWFRTYTNSKWANWKSYVHKPYSITTVFMLSKSITSKIFYSSDIRLSIQPCEKKLVYWIHLIQQNLLETFFVKTYPMWKILPLMLRFIERGR